jgi:hypothetical protein
MSRCTPCSNAEAREILLGRYIGYHELEKFHGIGFRRAKPVMADLYKRSKEKYGWFDHYRIPTEYFIEFMNINVSRYGL